MTVNVLSKCQWIANAYPVNRSIAYVWDDVRLLLMLTIQDLALTVFLVRMKTLTWPFLNNCWLWLDFEHVLTSTHANVDLTWLVGILTLFTVTLTSRVLYITLNQTELRLMLTSRLPKLLWTLLLSLSQTYRGVFRNPCFSLFSRLWLISNLTSWNHDPMVVILHGLVMLM